MGHADRPDTVSGSASGTESTRAARTSRTRRLAKEDDLASADLLAVDRGDSPRLVPRIEALYRVGELHGLAAAKAWLTEHGITWRELGAGAASTAVAAGSEGTAADPSARPSAPPHR
jgi:hypothetical protein